MCGPSHSEIMTHVDLLFKMERSRGSRVYDVTEVAGFALDAGVAEAQFCRTCARQERRVQVSLSQLASIRKNGGSIEDVKCHPNEMQTTRRIHQDLTQTDAKVNLKSLGKSIESLPDGKVKVHLTQASSKKAVAIAHVCGQEILDKCRSCGRFERIEAEVVGGKSASGRPWFKKVLIGGFCRIPADGITVNGRVVHCAKIPRRQVEFAQSCDNCAYASSHTPDQIIEHATPVVGDLSRYEMTLARRANEPGIAIAQARQAIISTRARVHPHTPKTTLVVKGFWKFFNLEIARTIFCGDQPSAVDLRIPDIGDVVRFSLHEGDDAKGLVTIVSKDRAVLQIMSPHHRAYGLPDNMTVNVGSTPPDQLMVCGKCEGSGEMVISRGTKECDRCQGIGMVRRPLGGRTVTRRDLSSRMFEGCMACGTIAKGQPCGHHAKAATLRDEIVISRMPDDTCEITREVTSTYDDPEAVHLIEHLDGSRHLRVLNDVVVDEGGATPSWPVLVTQARGLLERTRDAKTRQAITMQLNRARRAWVNPNVAVATRMANLWWIAPHPAEPFHKFCEINVYDRSSRAFEPGSGRPKVRLPEHRIHPNLPEVVSLARGIDMASVWNDAFGTPRSEMSTNPVMEVGGQLRRDPKFSLTAWQENEDWMRRFSTGEVLQDEILAAIHTQLYGRPNAALEVTAHGHVEDHPMPAHPVVTKLGVGIPNTNFVFDDTAQAAAWLDQDIVVPGDDDTASWHASNRYVALGYENFRNTSRLSGDDVGSVFAFNHDLTFGESAPETDEVFWACTSCYNPLDADAGKFAIDEVNATSLACPDPGCDGTLVFIASAEDWRDDRAPKHLDIGSDQIGPSDAYRPRRSGAADSSAWQTRQRLQEMSCPSWKSMF